MHARAQVRKQTQRYAHTIIARWHSGTSLFFVVCSGPCRHLMHTPLSPIPSRVVLPQLCTRCRPIGFACAGYPDLEMECRVDITVGFAGKQLLHWVGLEVSLGYLFDYVVARLPPDWMSEYRLIRLDGAWRESYTRLRADATRISQVAQDYRVHVHFVSVPMENIEHTPGRPRKGKEFEMFASKVASQLPVSLRPSSLSGTRSGHLYQLPRDVEILDAKTLLRIVMQCEATRVRDDFAAEESLFPRGRSYVVHEAHHALFDRALRKHAAFLSSLDGPFLRKKARHSLAAEIEKWLTSWRGSREHCLFWMLLHRQVWETAALGCFT